MSPGRISPSRVPWVTSSGRVLAMIIWYFMLQEVSFLELVLPQWKPMKVSLLSIVKFALDVTLRTYHRERYC